MRLLSLIFLVVWLLSHETISFTPNHSTNRLSTTRCNSKQDLEKKFGGYTVKQRLREEVESPFRTVRLFFFGSSTASALLALYFSTLSTIKALSGNYPEVDLNDSLQSCAINVGAAILCGFLTYRDWQAGNSNLARIAKGGALAKLPVAPMNGLQDTLTLSDYRRTARVLIAAGDAAYIETLCRSLSADQKDDPNPYAEGLYQSDVIAVPVLLTNDGYTVGDSRSTYMNTAPQEADRNFDANRAARVLAFPKSTGLWQEYLKSEIDTMRSQDFDPLTKGFTILVKKNGKILRRTTGQPPLANLIGTMEVMDGSRFGMPGDDEKYGPTSRQR